MTEVAEKLKNELFQLSIQERAELAYFLIHSLDGETDDNVESAWDAKLLQRMQEIDSGTAFGQPASRVLDQLRAKYL